jgi:hypothetical protein
MAWLPWGLLWKANPKDHANLIGRAVSAARTCWCGELFIKAGGFASRLSSTENSKRIYGEPRWTSVPGSPIKLP